MRQGFPRTVLGGWCKDASETNTNAAMAAPPVLRSASFIILVDQILDPLEQKASLLGPDFGFEVHQHIFAK